MSDTAPASAPCMWMRGGTSKGAFFLSKDLPNETALRDEFLLRIMGSPDPSQIDGIGGADPLTSKVAVISPSSEPNVDLDYLFLQVWPDEARVSSSQNCGNLLAAVGPFAVERGLLPAARARDGIRIQSINSGQIVTTVFETKNGNADYSGNTAIDGVPGLASPVILTFEDAVGATCGSLLPTGHTSDTINGLTVTCIDGGMPTVIVRAKDLDMTGQESRNELDTKPALRDRLDELRLQAGKLMGMGDVTDLTVPKITMVSRATGNGVISTRTFIPHRFHASIGVLGGISVATACVTAGTVANELAILPADHKEPLWIEHLAGRLGINVKTDREGKITNAAVIRTARKLFDGTVFAGPPREPETKL